MTYNDWSAEEWIMIMPNEVRIAFADEYQPYLEMAQKGVKRPSARDLRFVSMLKSLYGGEDD